MSSGKFVVLEGLDRSGKTTVVDRLYERLKDCYPVEKIRFPNRSSEIGSIIDKYLKKEIDLTDETIHLLFSCDRYEHRGKIAQLRKECILLCDRYSMSGFAFSACKGLNLEWCITADELLPKPDLTVFLDVSPEALRGRPGFGSERYETVELQSRAYKIYKDLISRGDSGNIFSVDATLPIEEVVERIMKKILE